MLYFIIINQEQIGPLSLEQLKQYHLSPQTKVWREGLQDWIAASQLSELSGLVSSRQPQYIVNGTTTSDSNKYQTLLIIIACYIALNTFFWTIRNIVSSDYSEFTKYISLFTSTIHNCFPIVIGIFIKHPVFKVLLICLGILALGGSIYNASRWW